jgi:predicted RNase H-related nuclease YkuK (DUF458 family)
MLDAAKSAIRDSSLESSVYIGSDSIRFKKAGIWYARYSTVVILHIDSKHGCKLFHNTEVQRDFGNMKQRLLNEVMYTVNLALELVDHIGDRHLEVHLDLNSNPNHKSNVAVKEGLGYVHGCLPGVQVEIKPNGWAASACADHLVRGKGL